MSIDRPTAIRVAEELRAAAAEIFARHGLDTNVRTKTKYGDSLDITLSTAKLVVEDGVNVASAEALAFKRYAAIDGVDPEALGKTFVSRGETYRLTGYLPRGQRFKFSARREIDGKNFKFPASLIAASFPRA